MGGPVARGARPDDLARIVDSVGNADIASERSQVGERSRCRRGLRQRKDRREADEQGKGTASDVLPAFAGSADSWIKAGWAFRNLRQVRGDLCVGIQGRGMFSTGSIVSSGASY